MSKRASAADALADMEELPGFQRTSPQYFSDPMIDKLLEIIVLQGGEIWANRDRQMVMEHLLATEGKVTSELIEAFKPDEAFQRRLDAERQRFVRQTYQCLYEDRPTPAKISAAWREKED